MLNQRDIPQFRPDGTVALISDPVIEGTAAFPFMRDNFSESAEKGCAYVFYAGLDEYPDLRRILKNYFIQLDMRHDEIRKHAGRMRFLGSGAAAGIAATGIGIPVAIGVAAGALINSVRYEANHAVHPERVEVRRIVYSQRWARENRPPLRISPGESREFTADHTSGMSWAMAENAGSNMGINLPIGKGELSATLSASLNRNLTIQFSRTDTFKTKISNDRQGYYREMAFWFIRHGLTVETFEISQDNVVRWASRAQYHWDDPYSNNSSYVDVPA
jgi:hypothetical protein